MRTTARLRRAARRAGVICAAGLFGAGCVGCAAPTGIHSRATHHVLILPGVAGLGSGIGQVQAALGAEWPDASAQIWDWTQLEPALSLGGLANLTQYSVNLARARTLANQLRAWRRAHPDVELNIVALSGGVGITLFCCEWLPEDFAFGRIVLLSGAVSPGYDLAPALRRCRRGIVNYYSPRDVAVLGAGTTNHGTMDRVFGPAAGLSGFLPPDDPVLASKLEQVSWNESMLGAGNDGLHWGSLSPVFLRAYVVRWLRDGGE